MAAKKRGQVTRALARRTIVQAPLAPLSKTGADRGATVIRSVPPLIVAPALRYTEALAQLEWSQQSRRPRIEVACRPSRAA